VANAKACVALLAPCAVDYDCCSGACATPLDSTLPQGTCTAGAGMCAGEDSTCLTDSDCCAGRCDFRMVTSPGRGQCSSVCRGFGESCKLGECCGGYCSEPSPNCLDGPQCLECLTPTIADGHSCVADYDCCGETCVGAEPQSPGTCECMTPGGCND
jgi:hypothetical protein